ncbi:MAG: nicotinate (nicotinamide) nucleotide adenylyltransferase [Bacteroidia bacterium]
MNIGLFFGSFNPIHTGHLIIANYMVDYTKIDEVWFVVSPQNPFKTNEELLHEKHRYAMVQAAIDDNPKFKACDVEFYLQRPSYTDYTLTHLRETYTQHTFILIIGGDNLQSFNKWKNYENILNNHEVYVYARTGIVEMPLLANHPNIKLFEVPLLNISSTYIRESIKAGKSIKYLVTENVEKLIVENGFYKE